MPMIDLLQLYERGGEWRREKTERSGGAILNDS